jgi:hypothetical protein
LREDVAPAEVVRERKQTEVQVDGRRLRLTNLRKVLCPEGRLHRVDIPGRPFVASGSLWEWHPVPRPSGLPPMVPV